MHKSFLTILVFSVSITSTFSQCRKWQQRGDVSMNVSLDVNTHRFSGTQTLVYQNNSPDMLKEVYYHLFFNAFKPNSEMDVRSRTIEDPDSRVGSRIAELDESQMGDLKVLKMTINKKPVEVEHLGTVLRAVLPTPIKPGGKVVLTMDFEGQVPIQIRRSGRDNKEGVAYSMTQWFPKIAEYDERGWHADPYVGREFYGVWGDYDVKISLDASYVVAATGVLQNPGEVGHGYGTLEPKRQGAKDLTWHFVAKNVHDFAWAADPDYVHTTRQVKDGPLLRFFRKSDDGLVENWEKLPEYMEKAMSFLSENFGEYPYPVYSFVQGGDGGMEYPMLTLITGKRRLGSLVGVSVHELAHSWYQGALANNESSYPWMDEGFTEYASSKTMAHLFPDTEKGDPHASSYKSYFNITAAGKDEPMSTHGDHFTTNYAYGVNAYSKGEMFVAQLRAVIGDNMVNKGMRSYFNTCKFKHPTPVDFERVMERESGLELDWYFDEWINTTRTLDYSIGGIWQVGNTLTIQLQNESDQIMPIDLAVIDREGNARYFHIPLSLMLGAKQQGAEEFEFEVVEPWLWTHPTYELKLEMSIDEVSTVIVDPFSRLADIDRDNDILIVPEGMKGMVKP